MISIKEAAQGAADFCQQLFPDAKDMLLEEVERDEDGKFWLITISFLAAAVKQVDFTGPGLLALSESMEKLSSRRERRYKSLKVDAQTGEVVSMKIRELQS
ncbi:MAG: hypothetical protein H7Z72_03220 [Bacteroidetes bacterium]|nr:hypothetical protein [Fibrella sp.]